MGCDPTFLRKPAIKDLLAMGNDQLLISVDLWQDKAKTVPYPLSGYTGRGALKLKSGGAPVAFSSVVVTSTSVLTNVTAILLKATVETLSIAAPYVYDVSVDSAAPDSFTVATGIITFRTGAST